MANPAGIVTALSQNIDVEAATPLVTEASSHDPNRRLVSLSVHEPHSCRDDVVLDLGLLAPTSLKPGTLLQFNTLKSGHNSKLHGLTTSNDVEPSSQYEEHELAERFIFPAVPIGADVLSKQPNVQISVSQQIATVLQFEKGSRVLLSCADELSCRASHIEIVFRDQYLARADMWRFINTELANKIVYRGQKIVFLNTIKATVKSVFINGSKVSSALFHTSTKPIFRSESARYVLFIQMSREMWDFDAQGSGEIMFDKVINGFLPEMFNRWQQLQVRHLVSIVLFTRMVYNDRPAALSADAKSSSDPLTGRSENVEPASEDFYRVVVSDMASGEWVAILNQLKMEFKVFLRDVSIRKPVTGDYVPLGSGLPTSLKDTPDHVIAGHPSSTTVGNVLEAINLASSQFSSDYIDRDLVRTGVSIVLISPGTGVFEVDYNLLVATTDNLIDNGIGIDLVCLSNMPLHSVPLFKYKQPRVGEITQQMGQIQDDTLLSRSFSKTMSYGTPSAVSPAEQSSQFGNEKGFIWNYGVPHWIDISFWTTPGEHDKKASQKSAAAKNKADHDRLKHKPFIPRVRMYELQMMGVMENSVNDISIPRLCQNQANTSGSEKSGGPMKFAWPDNAGTKLSPASFIDTGAEAAAKETSPLLSSSPASARALHSKSGHDSFGWMDDYDDNLFRDPTVKLSRRDKPIVNRHQSNPRRSRRESLASIKLSENAGQEAAATEPMLVSDTTNQRKINMTGSMHQTKNSIKSATSDGRRGLGKSTNLRRDGLTPRQISFSRRGLGIGAPKASTTTDFTAAGGISASKLHSKLNSQSENPVRPEIPTTVSHASGDVNQPDTGSRPDTLRDQPQSSESEPSPTSRPIPIQNPAALRNSQKTNTTAINQGARQYADVAEAHDRVAALMDTRAEKVEKAAFRRNVELGPQLPTLSPNTVLAPWLTVLNPSNPSKTKLAFSTQIGRWHHIFPRPLRASQIKWKSLCSPAAVPLTTEDFPSSDQLAEEYRESSYLVTLPEEMDLSEKPRSLVNELLAFRLARGFQIVVGDRVAEAYQQPLFQSLDIFSENVLSQIGSFIVLSRGTTIQVMKREGIDRVEIKVLVRHSTAKVKSQIDDTQAFYTPLIRSMLADTYEAQMIPIAPQRGLFNWDMIDAFIAGHERPQAAQYVENLRPWRARFVLIPVDPPSNARGAPRSKEDNEEEIRLEGIRKLTQLWQRFRYFPPEERRYQAPARPRKDRNPLDVTYHTKDPSMVVLAELESVVEGDATGRPVQLLPEPDLFQRPNLNMKVLADTIQSEKGVRLIDRRWHWRLHIDCFIGNELTTWLLENFRDVDARDEAVALGRELLKDGMFEHVEKRHDFRDGNYFYQMVGEYRTRGRPETRGWFGRAKASVPSTPMTERGPQEYPSKTRSRASSNTMGGSETDLSSDNRRAQKLSVALSKSLIYDVDHRKRSYRPELVNLHHDRLHNPDNCYHIRCEWMNTTTRLIQDAVVSWATSVDRFGLRLVEVPIGEASSITSTHPFRAPYLVKLALSPPEKQPPVYYDTISFDPQPLPKPDKRVYQKAIMKRFNFVLDYEAASDFPADVDVSYSWGKPDYRYPQYIHRSGVLIAQITDDGHFLLLANRLYNNRSAANATYQQPAPTELATETLANRSPNFYRSSPRRSRPFSQSSAPGSPVLSPASGTTKLEVPPTSTPTRGPSPTNSAPLPTGVINTTTGFTRSGASTAFATPEQITRDFQAFCSNKSVLQEFYDEQLSKPVTPGPTTPYVGSEPRTPLRGAEKEKVSESEAGIPSLSLPGNLVFGNSEVGGSARRPWLKAEARRGGGESPKNAGTKDS